MTTMQDDGYPVKSIEIEGKPVSHAQFFAMMIGAPKDDSDRMIIQMGDERFVVSKSNHDALLEQAE